MNKANAFLDLKNDNFRICSSKYFKALAVSFLSANFNASE